MKHRLWLHILFWLTYVLFEAYIEFAWLSSPGATTPALQRWWMGLSGEISQLPIKVPLSYFIIYLINNGSAKIKRPVFILLAAIGAFAIAVILHRVLIIKLILPHLYHEKVSDDLMFKLQRVISSFLDLLFVVGLAVAIKQYRVSQHAKEKEKGLVKEKLEAELKFLRTQTNPHFLFNTLNNIYALARKKSDDTADVVMKLSKLLRFMLYESKNSCITLAEELRVLKDYIELERIRYNERLTISFTESIDNETQPIAPLILLPFVENAFKHGAGETRFNSFIYIHVQLNKGQLIFTIENSKDDGEEEKITENIGLSNVRRQLELMYPEHHLDMEIGKTVFKVTLTINLRRHATV
ncbi:MAG TPA: sensor histidine kinase [Chitinophagaceae bacterium]|nr:sensor histidine kinase [Chitinophagaceae bacterium]